MQRSISLHPSGRRQQRGAAALIVVMVLFFIVSMVAAYTSRNLIFEQRTAANQYRSTQGLEAADAGAEWALAQLNAGRITDACTPSTNDGAATDGSFRQRYVNIDPSTGSLTVTLPAVLPRCVIDTTAVDATGAENPQQWKWSCSCTQPTATTSLITGPNSTSFSVLPRRLSSGRPDILSLDVQSCTRLDDNCLNNAVGGSGDGVGYVHTLVALRGALTRPPAGALTLGGSLAPLPAGTTLNVKNEDAASNGITIHAAGNPAIPAPRLVLTGLPGSTGVTTAATGDSALAPALQPGFATDERLFALFFGIKPSTYARQPGVVQIDCSGGCAAADVTLALLRNPGHAIWLTGAGGTLTIDANIGSALAPVLLIVEGDVALADGVTVIGLLYGRKPSWTWTTGGTATIQGAAIAEGALLSLAGAAASSTSITYDAAVLKALRVSYGSFVRVPGSWRDFVPNLTP